MPFGHSGTMMNRSKCFKPGNYIYSQNRLQQIIDRQPSAAQYSFDKCFKFCPPRLRVLLGIRSVTQEPAVEVQVSGLIYQGNIK